MRKHVFLCALTAAAAVSLCGCGNVDGVSPPLNSGNEQGQTSPLISGISESATDLSGIPSSAPVTSTDIGESSKFPSKCNIYKASSVRFTDEQLFDFFNAHPECGTPQKSEYYADEYHRYEANGCFGHVSDGDNFLFRTDKGGLYDSAHYYLARLECCDDKYLSADGDSDFASRDEALKAVQKELSERFGIMPDEWYAFEFDAVKKDGVEAYKQKLYRDAYEPDTSYEDDDLEKEKQRYEMIKNLPADDYYYFNIKYKADDIPIFQGGLLDVGDMMTSGYAVSGTMSYLVYGRNGIEYIAISPAYKVSAAEYTEAELIPYEQARGLIQKKYDDLLTDSQVEVLDMNLTYLPIPQNDLGKFGSYELRPHYGFYITETAEYKGETYTVKKFTYFDAVTGEELTSVSDWEELGREWGFNV